MVGLSYGPEGERELRANVTHGNRKREGTLLSHCSVTCLAQAAWRVYSISLNLLYLC